MFAAILTEAGEIEGLPRAEARLTEHPDVYEFEWPHGADRLPMHSTEVAYAALFVCRNGGPCLGMCPLRDTATTITRGGSIVLSWHIAFPGQMNAQEAMLNDRRPD